MIENELIVVCRKQIEEKFHLPGNGAWKQRDFQYLSDLIAERTGTRISLSTLKRIWKEHDSRVPQLYTLNALVQLLDYNSWNDFKKATRPASVMEPQQSSHQPPPYQKPRFWLFAGVLLLIIAIPVVYFLMTRTTVETASVIFKSKKNISAGVPNTVVFEYDISKTGADSAIIQQSWDQRMRATVSGDNHFQTFIYYYPGFHTAKLIIGDKIIKEEKVNIATNGWEALVDGDVAEKIPFYIPKKDIAGNGSLYVSKETLLNNNIRANDQGFYINFFNVGNFGEVYAEDFTAEASVKNSLAEGGLVCQYTQLSLICENGLFSIPLCNPGCASNIHLHISDILRDGKKNDLAAFGVDLSAWQHIRIQSVKKEVTITINEKPVYKLRFNKDLGKITGFHFKFFGCGSVDSIRLWNGKKQLTYEEDFSSI